MVHSRTIFVAIAVLSSALATSAHAAPVSFAATDGVRVYGDFRRADGAPRATILLFHMAGSNRSEYAPLAPILNKAGFATLAIDQRSGGSMWGDTNKTAAQERGSVAYADAIPDLDAAVLFASMQDSGPILVWGSSYSSALVFIVAARHPEVKALLAFSPAEYIAGYSIAREAAKLSIPVFITSAPEAGEISRGRSLARAVPGHRAVQYVPKNGVHGSSTLRRDEDPAGADENWKHVVAFLDGSFQRR